MKPMLFRALAPMLLAAFPVARFAEDIPPSITMDVELLSVGAVTKQSDAQDATL